MADDLLLQRLPHHPSVFRYILDDYGIVFDTLPSSALALPLMASVDSSTGKGESEEFGGERSVQQPPSYRVPAAPPQSSERVKMVQLWGLKHCVDPAWECLLSFVKPNDQCLRHTLRIGTAAMSQIPWEELKPGKNTTVRVTCRLFPGV